jgi:hypothetical protein
MVTLFAFLGCCGAIKESKTLLYTVSLPRVYIGRE